MLRLQAQDYHVILCDIIHPDCRAFLAEARKVLCYRYLLRLRGGGEYTHSLPGTWLVEGLVSVWVDVIRVCAVLEHDFYDGAVVVLAGDGHRSFAKGVYLRMVDLVVGEAS